MTRPIIAFDLDGTLVDSVADLAAALNAALGEVALGPCALDDLRAFVGNGARMLVMRALARSTSTAASELAQAQVDDVLARFQRHYDTNLVGQTTAFDGIAAMLAQLKPHALLAVATNKPGRFARPLVEALLPHTFACVVGPDDVGTLKPDPLMLHSIERQLDGRVVAFVGDSGVDVETARNAGVVAVGVAWGLKPDELGGADVVAQTPAQLAAVLSEVLRAPR